MLVNTLDFKDREKCSRSPGKNDKVTYKTKKINLHSTSQTINRARG